MLKIILNIIQNGSILYVDRTQTVGVGVMARKRRIQNSEVKSHKQM